MPRPSSLKFVGVREFKEKLTGLLAKKEEVVVTRHGKPIARVVPVAKGVELDELRAFLRDRLSGPKLPRVFRVAGPLPRNANGKVDRTAVRDGLASDTPPT